jgi:hypothetical protein
MGDGVEMTFATTDVWGGQVLEWADKVTGVKDLVDQAAKKLKPGDCIKRLIIVAHGAEKTDGFMAFDNDTSQTEFIAGGYKNEVLSKAVTEQFTRLKKYLCPDAVIEFRVCRFGKGENGARAMQAVSDLTGATVTGPMDEMKSIMGLGGLAVDWRTTWPGASAGSSVVSYWRAVTRPKTHAAPQDIAPVTAQTVPVLGVPLVNTPPTAPAPTVTGPAVPPGPKVLAGAGAALVVTALLIGSAVGRQPASASAAPATSTATAAAQATPIAGNFTCTGDAIKLFDNSNGQLVSSGATPPTFSTNGKTYCIVYVFTYHWNGSKGAIPGTIGLRGGGGALGPWRATGSSGQNNAPNVDWTAVPPETVIINGSYQCTDSDPATWAQNAASGGQGFCRVWVKEAVAR